MHDGIEAIMEQRSIFKKEMNKQRKPKPPKLDAAFRNKIANYFHLINELFIIYQYILSCILVKIKIKEIEYIK